MKPRHLLGLALTLFMAAEAVGQPASPPRYDAFDPVFYFESGGVKVLPPGDEVWPRIAGYFAKTLPEWVHVRAHTAALGTPEENLVLSRRRAEAVAKRIVRMGVDPAIISISACGESEPAVAPGDRVWDGLNDRVTVDWGSAPTVRPPEVGASCRTSPYAD